MTSAPLRLGSLFSGYGGLEMAANHVLGSETAWVSDVCRFDKDGNAGHYEPHRGPCRILAHRFPDVPNLGDVTRIDWASVEPVDILTGGSPCQDLSHAGKRGGMTEGTRSNLWVTMREAIAQLRPQLVIWENVRGAYSAEADSDLESCPRCVGDPRDRGPVLRALGRVLGDLADLGFDAEWTGLRAADVGAPHGRFRVFVVAYPAGDARRIQHGDGAAAALADHRGSRHGRPGENGRPELVDGLRDGGLLPTPRTSDTNGAGAHGDGGVDLRTAVALLPTPVVTDSSDSARHTTSTGVAHPGTSLTDALRLLPTPMSRDFHTGYRAGRAAPGRAGGPPLNDAVRDADAWGLYADAIARWEALTRPVPSPTQPSKKGTPQLSAAFSEWLMGLPAGWVTDVPGITRNEALKALGNGVVPQQAEAALRLMLGAASVGAVAG